MNNIRNEEREKSEASSHPWMQDIDRHVGARLRSRRVMLGLKQQELADLIGVTYQQEHKYEKGINRISCGRLFRIAQALGVEVTYFFEDVDDSAPIKPSGEQRLLLELARNFTTIQNRLWRDAVCDLVRALASDNQRDNGDLPPVADDEAANAA